MSPNIFQLGNINARNVLKGLIGMGLNVAIVVMASISNAVRDISLLFKDVKKMNFLSVEKISIKKQLLSDLMNLGPRSPIHSALA